MCSESGSLEIGFEFGRSFDLVKFLHFSRAAGEGSASGSGSGGALFLADASDLLLRSFVAGVDLGGVEELGQRALKVAGRANFVAFADVDDDAVTRTSASAILKRVSFGSLSVGLLVVVEGGVVVLAGLGGLALLEIGVGRFGVKLRARDAEACRCGKQDERRKRVFDPMIPATAGAACDGSSYSRTRRHFGTRS
jgi:hypothetical protein